MWRWVRPQRSGQQREGLPPLRFRRCRHRLHPAHACPHPRNLLNVPFPSLPLHPQLFEATQKLAQQPQGALLALLELHSAAGGVLSGVQKARCAALYRPLFPDIAAICSAALEEHSLLPA